MMHCHVHGPPYYNESGIPSSCWVAIDAVGHVGLFECGEAGAVPLPWPLGTLAGDFFVDRFPLDALRAGRVLSSGRTLPSAGARRVGRRVVATIDRSASNATYRSEQRTSSFETLLEPDRARILSEATPRALATLRPLDARLVSVLTHDPCVTRSIDEDALVLWIDGLSDTGVFRWKSLDPEAVGVYSRTDHPTRPIEFEELPQRARNELGLVRMPITFADAEELQLADHFARADLVTRAPADGLRRTRTP